MAAIGRIRQNVGLLVFIIAIAILGFLLMDIASGPGALGGGQAGQSVGSVNGVDLDYNKYQKKVQDATNRLQQGNPNVSEQQRLQLRETTWDQHIKDILADVEMDKVGVSIPSAEMIGLVTTENAHPSIKNDQFFKNPETGMFDPSRVRQYIKSFSDPELSAGQSDQAKAQWMVFEDYLKRDAKKSKYLDLVKKAIYVPSWYAEDKHTEDNKKVDLSYVLVPYTKVDDADISFTDSDLKTYLNNHKAEYEQEASVDLSYVKYAVQPSDTDRAEAVANINNLKEEWLRGDKTDSLFIRLRSETDFSSAYLTSGEMTTLKADSLLRMAPGSMMGPFFEDNFYKVIKVVDTRMVADSVECRHILKSVAPGANAIAAKKSIDSLYAILKTGYDFSVLAANNSDDQGSVESGGELGYAKKGQMVQPFNDAIFYQMGTGDIKVVRSQFGYHLIEVTSSVPSKQAAKLAILSRELSASSKTSNAIFAQANTFASMYTNASTFATGAAEKGLNVQMANRLRQNDYNVPGLGANDQIPSWAFQNDVGDVSNVFTVDDNYVVALVTGKRNAGMPNIEDVRAQLEAEVKKSKKGEKLVAQMQGIGNDLGGVSNQLGVSFQNASGIAFGNNSGTNFAGEPEVVAAALGLGVGETSAPIAGSLGVYQVKVDNVVEAAALGDYSAVATQEANAIKNRADFSVWESIKNAADVVDTRFETRSQ